MNDRRRRNLLWVASAAIWLLATLSILGAFLGAPRARGLFNSLPLALYWAALGVLLVAGMVGARAMRRRLGLLAMHLGAALVILGGMIGSDTGHRLANRWLGRDKPPGGYLWLLEGWESSDLLDEDGVVVGRLPFAVRLEEVRIEYYPAPDRPWSLYLSPPPLRRGGEPVAVGPVEVPWRIGEEVAIPQAGGTIEVVEYLPHAKPVHGPAGQVIGAEPAGQGLPALKAIVRRGAEAVTGWFFGALPESWPAQAGPGEARLYLAPPERAIRAYKTHLAVLSGGRSIPRQLVEVNRPMHLGGYHFYQYDYDPDGRSVVLLVKSDSGLAVVYAGLAFLLAGVFWHFWVGPIRQGLGWKA